MSNEQRVRTMAGWIGVEISRSRVRTPGKPGFGLYRVRGAGAPVTGRESDRVVEPGVWTGYVFKLAQLAESIERAIEAGTPAKPGYLVMEHPNQAPGRDWPANVVPTRWTSAYRGRRNLGERTVLAPGQVSRGAYEAMGGPLAELLNGGPSVPSDRLQADLEALVARSTVRSRQRADNAAFQAAHLRRRAYGLTLRYAAKRARNSAPPNDPAD